MPMTIDPVLTNAVRGYMDPEAVATALFPRLFHNATGGRVPLFSTEQFTLYDTLRAHGSATKRIEIVPGEQTFAMESHGLEGKVPVERQADYSSVAGIDLGANQVQKVMSVLMRRLEYQASVLATTTGNFTNKENVVSAPWTTGTNDPFLDIEAGIGAILSAVGVKPNVALFGYDAWAAFKNNALALDRIKHTNFGVMTEDIAARAIGVDRVVVGAMTYRTQAGVATKMWGANCILAYVASPGGSAMETPSFGSTYTLDGYPAAMMAYEDENTRSMIYPVHDVRIPKLVMETAGHLIYGTTG